MSRLDQLLDILNELKQDRVDRGKFLAKQIGKLEVFRKIMSEPKDQMMLTFFQLVIKEMDLRESEDLTIVELTTTLFSEQTKDINQLRQIILSLASEDKLLTEQLNKLKKRVDDRLKFDQKLDKYLEEWKKTKEKTQEAIKKSGLII